VATDPPRSRDHRARWRGLLQNGGDRLLDRYLGTQTAGLVWHEELGFTPADGEHYQTSNWVNLILLRRVLRQLRPSDREVFIDFGCGKGQVLALAARYPFRRIIGLDLSDSLLAVAARNMERIRRRSRCDDIELVHMNALDYRLPDDVTVAYFYMPFPTSTYERVVSRLAESVDRNPRSISIIYLNEGPEDPDVPIRHGFRKVARQRRMAMYRLDPRAAARPASHGPAVATRS
jgi:SAM-dependent methyltransferase